MRKSLKLKRIFGIFEELERLKSVVNFLRGWDFATALQPASINYAVGTNRVRLLS